MIHGVSDLCAEIENRFGREAFLRDTPAERFAGDILHGDIWLPIHFADFVDGADIWVVQSGGCPRFAQDLGAYFGVGDGASRRQFEGDITAEGFVSCPVDYTHAPGPSLFEHGVVCKSLADHCPEPARRI